MIDRSKYYKKPLKFGAQTLYDSKILTDVSLAHWKIFDESVKSNQNFKIGDFIDVSVNQTAVEMVKFLEKISEMNFEEINEFIKSSIEEIQKEILLK